MLCRIIKTKKSTEVVLVQAITEDLQKINMIFERALFDEYNIVNSNIVDLDVEKIKYFKGNDIWNVVKINKLFCGNKKEPYKNPEELHYSQKTTINRKFIQAYNAGDNLKKWIFKQKLTEQLSKLMTEKGFMRIYTNNIMDERGTSIVNPMKVSSNFSETKYLKITNELLLKEASFLTMQPVFEIGYVSRDIYKNRDDLNEYLSLEAVQNIKLNYDLAELYHEIYETAVETAQRCGLEDSISVPPIRIVDVLKEFKYAGKFDIGAFKDYYKTLVKTLDKENVIFVNAPTNSPLAKKIDIGIGLETKWRLCGAGVGHGYWSEIDHELVSQHMQYQVDELKSKGVDTKLPLNFINSLKYAGMENCAFNLGIDRFYYKFLGYPSIRDSENVLGL